MRTLNFIISILFLAVFFLACNSDDEAEYVYPKEYLPAYPFSFWDYTNGERVTSTGYESHSYKSNAGNSGSKYVPYYNGSYLYEYSIYQFSENYPLKKLLDETPGEQWIVNELNNVKYMRQVTEVLDNMLIKFPPYTNPIDSVFTDVVVVVEYTDSLGVERWNTKEYYAKNIGLIQVEINNPLDENIPIIQKQIRSYSINK